FPPRPPSIRRQAQFLREWAQEFSVDSVEEEACAVCACLYPRARIRRFEFDGLDLSCLHRSGDGITRVERVTSDDPVGRELPGPVLYLPSVHVEDGRRMMWCCDACHRSLTRKEMPLMSLANGRWIGDVPCALQGLSYAEELMIARYRRNYCVAHVGGIGQGFLKANAIVFEQPTMRVYDVLPPPKADMDECLAIIFTGSVRPSGEDYKRTPFIVRHRKVYDALRWLKLNNPLYNEVEISLRNLADYEDGQPPVFVMFRKSDG
ncbi:hypothetical protein FKP32DRAFT_1550978, partial [Trametes sanguinea]